MKRRGCFIHAAVYIVKNFLPNQNKGVNLNTESDLKVQTFLTGGVGGGDICVLRNFEMNRDETCISDGHRSKV